MPMVSTYEDCRKGKLSLMRADGLNSIKHFTRHQKNITLYVSIYFYL